MVCWSNARRRDQPCVTCSVFFCLFNENTGVSLPGYYRHAMWEEADETTLTAERERERETRALAVHAWGEVVNGRRAPVIPYLGLLHPPLLSSASSLLRLHCVSAGGSNVAPCALREHTLTLTHTLTLSCNPEGTTILSLKQPWAVCVYVYVRVKKHHVLEHDAGALAHNTCSHWIIAGCSSVCVNSSWMDALQMGVVCQCGHVRDVWLS